MAEDRPIELLAYQGAAPRSAPGGVAAALRWAGFAIGGAHLIAGLLGAPVALLLLTLKLLGEKGNPLDIGGHPRASPPEGVMIAQFAFWSFIFVIAVAYGVSLLVLSWNVNRRRPRATRIAQLAAIALMLAVAGYVGCLIWLEHGMDRDSVFIGAAIVAIYAGMNGLALWWVHLRRAGA